MSNIYINVALCRDSSGNKRITKYKPHDHWCYIESKPYPWKQYLLIHLGVNIPEVDEHIFTLFLSFSQIADVHISNKHIHSILKIQISPPPRTIVTRPCQLVCIWMLGSRSSFLNLHRTGALLMIWINHLSPKFSFESLFIDLNGQTWRLFYLSKLHSTSPHFLHR